MLVTIYKFEDDTSNEPLCTLNNGQYALGRGQLLQCSDKRVSRNHIAIEVAVNNATITAKHEINPCFYRAAESSHISILKYNQPLELSNGDSFGFFPDQYWFKLNILATQNGDNNSSPKAGNKRLHSENDDNEGEAKVAKLSDNDACTSNAVNGEICNGLMQNGRIEETSHELNETLGEVLNEQTSHENIQDTSNNTSNSDKDELNEVQSRISVRNDLIQNENVNKDEMNTTTHSIHSNITDDDPIEETVEKKKRTTTAATQTTPAVKKEDSDDDDGPSAPTTRDRCWYGTNCYRRNAQHKAQFSHAGDDDYDTDENDDRPQCEFGASCYRKNTQHRKDFKHARFPKSPNQKKPKPKPKVDKSFDDDAKVDASNIVNTKRPRKKKQKLNETPPDSYDYSDPFLDDDSDDEYVPSDTEEDSEMI